MSKSVGINGVLSALRKAKSALESSRPVYIHSVKPHNDHYAAIEAVRLAIAHLENRGND